METPLLLILVGYGLVLATAAAAFLLLNRESKEARGRMKHALTLLKYCAAYLFIWVAFELLLKFIGVRNFTLFDFPVIVISYFVVLGLALAAKSLEYR
ncbi:MAG: hypothetical protein V1834_02230 [Candidatus Micrarchaeota archaeon]